MGPLAPTPQADELFRPRLDEQLKMSHPLIRLAHLIDWARIEQNFSQHFTTVAAD
jgi:IS5 family transposase